LAATCSPGSETGATRSVRAPESFAIGCSHAIASASAILLDIQLDAHAGFLARWRDLLLRTLTPGAVASHADRGEFRDVVDSGWSGVAAPDSAAYRLTRMFREEISDRAIAFLLSECYDADPMFDYKNVRRRDGPIWKLVNEQPMHLLDPQFASWNDLLLDAVDTVITRVRAEHGGPLKERVWSEFNQTLYRHPLSAGVPLLGRWLDMPAVPLPAISTLRTCTGGSTRRRNG
jgi:penicillin amidase